MKHWLLDRIYKFDKSNAFIFKGNNFQYDQLSNSINKWVNIIFNNEVRPGDSVAVIGDYSPDVVSLILALGFNRNIIVPLSSVPEGRIPEYLDIAEADWSFAFDPAGQWRLTSRRPKGRHPLMDRLREAGDPGLILFSSGSTGASKASLLNFEKLLGKYREPRHAYRTLVFLTLDHIGGINTLLHVLSQGGTVITADDRRPETVLSAIADHDVQLLPTTPTFLNMLLISQAYRHYDLSSLEIITYGTEPMPERTLQSLHEALPHVRLKQTYGLSELGILPTRSKAAGSLWVQLGGKGFEHKVVDGVLWIRSDMAMLGYLNAPSPFDDDGWFNTQDMVEVDGEYLKILGRKSEIINVGGEKVYPAEVENVLLSLGNVRDVTVGGAPSPVTGQVVKAMVTLVEPEDPQLFKRRVRQYCRERLEPFKVPMIVELVDRDHHSARFKKQRVKTA